ncbi:DUF4011 domain-containing protein [Desulfatiferula olefinivorans]
MSETSRQPGGDVPLSVMMAYEPFVNFAMQQNGVPLVRALSVKNQADRAVTGVVVRLWSDPPVIVEKILRVEAMASGETCDFSDRSLTLIREMLRKQSEREEGHLWVEARAEGILPVKTPYPLWVLACNEWYGVSTLPEILAAHVLPNDPAVETILAAASGLLLEKTGDASLSGYQSGDPRRAYAQAAAIYYAAARQAIRYSNPPASFETTGQKIRTPEHLITRRLGTCLDTAVLLSACFEQAGLRPVPVLIAGHALVGVWLMDKAFDDTVTVHGSILLNRISLGEFLVIESTGITQTPPLSFKTALDQAGAQLKSDDSFRFAVDIRSARTMGIRPLSLVEGGESAATDKGGQKAGRAGDAFEDVIAPEALTEIDRKPPRDQESSADRLSRWKNSLLDLTLRNRLLNFRESKKTIPLMCPDIPGLEDALAKGDAFRVRPRPEAWGTTDPRDAALYQARTGDHPLAVYLREEMAQKRLHAAVTESDLAARLVDIERAARLGLEEGGANTLFLALGFLVWTESADSEIERRAPILLVPMSIERKAVREGFRIRRIDEESRINITLLEKLKSDFGMVIEGLDPLPEDESGLDVPTIFRTLRDAVKREPRWRVEDEACLTILTFSRFLMWLDLEANAEELKQNGVVRHLVESATETFEPEAVFPDLATLDERYAPANTFCPLLADSSQLRAVYAAAEGRTFVLQGPPGTGKSQTITNLIAHSLAVGKRVLFVAQKRAALDVVHKRLADVGFGPFCLELHSNKTTRESFRAQLREALNVAGTGAGGQWEAEANRLADQRRFLNAYVADLHQPRAFGKSAYWVISRLIGRADDPKVLLSLGAADGRSAEEFAAMETAVREMALAARVSGDPSGHPLAAVGLSAYVWGIEDDAARAIRDLESAQKDLGDRGAALLPEFGFDIHSVSFSDLKTVSDLTDLLVAAPEVSPALLTVPDWPRTRRDLTALIELGRDCAGRRSALLDTYTDDLFDLDIPLLIDKLKARDTAWFFKRWRLGVFVRKAVRAVRTDGKKPGDLAMLADELEQAQGVIEDQRTLDTQEKNLAGLLGSSVGGPASDWDALDAMARWTNRFRTALDQVRGESLDKTLAIRQTLVRFAVEGRGLFASGTPAAQAAEAFRKALGAVEQGRERLGGLLCLNGQTAWGEDSEKRVTARCEAAIHSLSKNLSRLREWTHYQAARKAAAALGLGPLAEALEEGSVGIDHLGPAFEHSFADWWARTLLPSIPTLSGFIGERHNLKIDAFRDQEVKIADLTRQEAFARIAGAMPRMAQTAQRSPASSEAGQLQRFVQGGRKTIRRIFSECPNAIARYKPCVLMSPLSVAQFIGADFPKFDLVVFDEASQMPTYDAIGAIARGKQLIVVGDSRQLPPTSFFERQKGDEEYSEDDLPEELESILDEADAAGIRSLTLDWHYRSRHESLIAFSNRQYYENRLHTFPSALAAHPRLGVRRLDVPDGVYDHGKSRTNRKEAESVVAEIVRRLRDPDEQGRSLGVVTFSKAQQALVEDLLDAARGEYPEIEPYFTSVGEPVFVKNLETVQGDERDVILFSICYGPDAEGIVRMNFGPLNNKGGERRLNVAVTRARRELLVFSRLMPDQIDLSRTQATGVHHLRRFLDYAGRGPSALIGETGRTGGETESFFEQSVLDELKKRGWIVDTQVGCSGYRIDLAVRDPERPGRYLLGVECDGANYHSAASARDRDRLRQAVLESLGWRLYRIWSTDWWLQRPREILKLEEALERALKSASTLDDTDLSPPSNIPSHDVAADKPDDEATARYAKAEAAPDPQPDLPPSLPAQLPGQEAYRRFTPDPGIVGGELHDPANKAAVTRLVRDMVQTEAPLLFDALSSAVASAWNLHRAGSRVRDIVRGAVHENGFMIRAAKDREFVWTREQIENPFTTFRVPDVGETSPRTAMEICPEEIANAATQVLRQHISMSPDDLARETARVFGITRLGTKVRAAFEDGLALMLETGACKINGDNTLVV